MRLAVLQPPRQGCLRRWRRKGAEAAEGSPSFTLDKLHLREGHVAADGKGRTGWVVWAVSCSQNNSLFTALASELAVGHQQRKGLTVPLRTPSLPKGQKCQLSLPSSCLVAALVPQGPGPCSLPAPSPAPAAGADFPRDGAPSAALAGAGGREMSRGRGGGNC